MLNDHLKHFKAAPFLFIGSGFSRRYLGLEDWKGLLQRFCKDNISSFDYYYSKANSNLAMTASLMSKDFSETWWKSDKFKSSRESYSEYGKMTRESSPLKYEISKYLSDINVLENKELQQELIDFKNVVVDGIITTNWDNLLEILFPDYDVYVGQSDLINSNVQEIGEIYKIHGSVNDFNSLVLTDEDYHDFNSKNPYLAAKLLSIFMEHPIIFIGYSISDSNIREILKSISQCISESGLKRMENSIFLVEPLFNVEEDTLEKSYINIDNHNLPITHIKAKNYSDIYIPLQSYKRKLSVKQLKQIKSQLYEIVKTNDPNERIALIDIDQDTNFADVDFVLGVGIKSFHEKGLIGIDREDIIEDIVLNNRDFDPIDMVNISLPIILKYQYRTPFFKYLREGNYFNDNDSIIENTPAKLKDNLERVSSELNNYGTRKLLERNPDLEYEYNLRNPNSLRAKISRDGKDSIDLNRLKDLLVENYEDYCSNCLENGNASNYRTIVRIYDWLKYTQN
ncbi:MAG: SIR2 family protein [Maledivibacter sp.]|nr:SIR2 family protein [Maledivibacter sp.]